VALFSAINFFRVGRHSLYLLLASVLVAVQGSGETSTNWNAASDFWWNGLTVSNSTSGDGLADWTNSVKAAQRGRTTSTNANA